VSIPYNADGHDFTGEMPTAGYQGTKLTDWSAIGATYGSAWQTTTERIYLSAYHKRLAGFGPNGIDAIYQLDRNGAIQGVIELDNFLTGTNTAGTDVHDFSANGGGVIFDANSYPEVGITSFGDIEISADMNTLYVMNLFDRKIYAFDVSTGNVASVSLLNTPGSTTTFGWSLPDPCGASEYRPFGLAWHEGKLWVGMVCEDATNAYVYSLDVAGTSFNLEVTVPMTYTREYIFSEAVPQNTVWEAWDNDIATVPYSINSAGANEEITYPQPMLTDIEFDPADGSMLLGFRDRWGDQMGQDLPVVPGTTTPRVFADGGGDLLRVCNNAGSWVLEGTSPCTTNGANLNSGPGGATYAEYYNWDFFTIEANWIPTTTSITAYHKETFMGGLLQLSNSTTIMSTAMDPFNDFSAGVISSENATGRRKGIAAPPAVDSIDAASLSGGYTIYDTGDYASAPPAGATFGKANGLGDLEAMCEPAPIQIGNFVWEDTDADGEQDADEVGLAGVRMELYSAAGVLLAFVNTNASGQYYFAGRDLDGATWQTTNDTLTPGTNYYIVAGGNGQYSGDQMTISGTDYQLTTNDAVSAQIDSDGTIASGVDPDFNGEPYVQISTGGVGQVDHSFDFGFFPCNLSASISTQICNDNNTGGNESDDYFSITLNATNATAGTSNQYQVLVDNELIGSSTYGSALTVEWRNAAMDQRFAADGSSTYTLTIRDLDNNNCNTTVTTTTVAECSDCPSKICLPIQIEIRITGE
ncbi:MAG: SdrD B-like domain-containing protein, partial [Saprospiraceae bacterium]